MKILDEFYDGNLSTNDRPSSYYIELDEISRLIRRHKEKLLADMTDEQKKHYLQIERYFGEQKKIDDRYSFLAGFRLGVQMMAESLGEEK